jgi:hypothetical protein
VSLTIEAENTWTANRFFGFPHPLAREHPVELLNRMLRVNGIGRALGKDKQVWHWVSQTRAGEDGRSPRLPFNIRSPKLRIKRSYYAWDME